MNAKGSATFPENAPLLLRRERRKATSLKGGTKGGRKKLGVMSVMSMVTSPEIAVREVGERIGLEEEGGAAGEET